MSESAICPLGCGNALRFVTPEYSRTRDVCDVHGDVTAWRVALTIEQTRPRASQAAYHRQRRAELRRRDT